MKQEEMQLGMRVRFRNVLEHRFIRKADAPGSSARKEWLPKVIWGGNADDWREGVLVGVRTLADGDYEFGSYDEQAFLYNKTYFRAALVVESMSTNPMRVRLEDVEPLPLLDDGVTW